MSDSVVITGLGACTALGATCYESLAGLRTCSSKISPLNASAASRWYGSPPGAEAPCQRKNDLTFQFAHDAAKTAVRQSRLNGSLAPDRSAVVMGSSKGRLHSLAATRCKLHLDEFPGETLGVELAASFGFRGPVLNYPAACATGLACLISATNLLRDHAVDMAIAGSAESSGYDLVLSSFANMGALSPNLMRPFHAERDGFNPGEGAAAFALERESDALARGARPLARIVGYDLRSDAYHMTAADPTAETVVFSIRRTMKKAGWDPSDVQYICAHGTGTPINDALEAKAIHQVFGDNCPPVSSLKPYFGHLLGASAAAELALSILSLQSAFIPPTPALDLPDPNIAPVNHVPPSGLQQPATRMLKLSLGFGGHIGCLAIELI